MTEESTKAFMQDVFGAASPSAAPQTNATTATPQSNLPKDKDSLDDLFGGSAANYDPAKGGQQISDAEVNDLLDLSDIPKH
mmetsp:Transcript_3392/g.6736  ORF Transcript_3392/g.6736 Transcript_3392/m.6736 type:complete len:81 (+) Transcript_3392:1142-1384(+)